MTTDKRVSISFDIDSGMHRRLKILAAQERKTMKMLIEDAIEILIRSRVQASV